jgi:hypothetical protein
MYMKPEWQSFLEDFGAEFEDNKLVHFGNDERERRVSTTGDVISDLSNYGLISAYGEETEQFLQNMLSNDIHQVDLTHSQLSSLCTQKGRMLSNFRIFKRGETWYLRLPAEMLELTLKRLQMFLLMTKSTLEDASNALVRFGFTGPEAENRLEAYLGSIPDEVDLVVECKGITIVRVPGIYPRFELYGELEPMKELWSHLNVHNALVGQKAWALHDILAGIPVIYPETSEAFVPQMANMHLVNGVSFKKGCYPGQEVVARMQYLGKLKRRMYLLNLDTDSPPLPGTAIHNGEDTKAGIIVDAQRMGSDTVAALAVMQVSSRDSKKLVIASSPEVKFSVGEPPYSFGPDAERA